MLTHILKIIGACVLGIFVGAALSVGTDKILESMGVLPNGNLRVGAPIIVFVLLYRTAYNILGSYLVAKFVPDHSMRYVIVVGFLGTLVAVVGAITTRNMNLGPEWYAWTLAALTLPSAWLGGKLYIKHAKYEAVLK